MKILKNIAIIPVHLQPFYKNLAWKKRDFPVAKEYYKHCLSLPMFPSLSDEEQDFVIKKVLKFISK